MSVSELEWESLEDAAPFIRDLQAKGCRQLDFEHELSNTKVVGHARTCS
jgi:hypothetical protein